MIQEIAEAVGNVVPHLGENVVLLTAVLGAAELRLRQHSKKNGNGRMLMVLNSINENVTSMSKSVTESVRLLDKLTMSVDTNRRLLESDWKVMSQKIRALSDDVGRLKEK